MDSNLTQIFLSDEAATLALGAALAANVQMGDTLALRGDLGAGKTTLARGLIFALTGEREVPSPTYTLVQTYDIADGELWHGDMYRLERPEDCLELGLDDAFLDCICLIEWPDKLGAYLPKDTINVTLRFEGAGRVAHVEGAHAWIRTLSIT